MLSRKSKKERRILHSMVKYAVVLEKGIDGMILAKVPSLKSCATQGKTVEEALERIKEAIKVCEPDGNTEFLGVEQVEV
jgi:predicted RNase H-like HicB family nuclease